MDKQKVTKALKQGPDYIPDNTYASITDTIDDYYNIKSTTRKSKQILKTGHDPIDSNDELANGKHPHLSDNIEANEKWLKKMQPNIEVLSKTPAGHDQIQYHERIHSIQPIAKKLNQNPQYAKKIHAYTGQQTIAYMNKQIREDKSMGLNDMADTDRIVENDVNPHDVYNDDVLHGNMDGEFGLSKKDIINHIKVRAPHDLKLQKDLGVQDAIQPHAKLKKHSFSNQIKNHQPKANKKQLRTTVKHEPSKAQRLNRQQDIQR